MSNSTNDILAEQVREYLELYTNTTAGNMLQFAWDVKDLETCRQLIKQMRELEHAEQYA